MLATERNIKEGPLRHGSLKVITTVPGLHVSAGHRVGATGPRKVIWTALEVVCHRAGSSRRSGGHRRGATATGPAEGPAGARTRLQCAT